MRGYELIRVVLFFVFIIIVSDAVIIKKLRTAITNSLEEKVNNLEMAIRNQNITIEQQDQSLEKYNSKIEELTIK